MGFIPYGVISKSHGLAGAVRLITHSGELSNLESIDSVYFRLGDTEEFMHLGIKGLWDRGW